MMIQRFRNADGWGLRIKGLGEIRIVETFLFIAKPGFLPILASYVAKIYNLRRTSTLALRQRKAALLRQLIVSPSLLRGSFVERFTTCGKPNCACATGARHGPFYYLTAHLGPGNIRKVLLKTPDQQKRIRDAVATYQSHWERLEELSQINLELFRRDEPLTPH